MAQRKTGQRISFAVGMLSYLAAAVTLAAFAYYYTHLGSAHPLVASLAATVVFFIGAGVVLHVMGAVSLPDLRPARGGSGSDDTPG
ncbi:MAG TPA: hemerythrin family protein [Sedimenticola sp.]|nr:hemerythrin family protein [Sedimenticola sp.]